MPQALKRKKKDGTPYERPAEIEAWLVKLEAIDPSARLSLFEVVSRKHAEYIPTEALVHFLRQAWANGNRAHFEKLFKLLLLRIEQSLHSSIPDARMDGASDIRDEIRGRFVEKITKDCNGKSSLLDFFEIRFDRALATMRVSVLRQMGPSTVKTVPLGFHNDDDELEISAEVESAAAEFLGGIPSQLDDPAFRLAFEAAIGGLPDDQKQVVGLLLKGIPIYCQEPDVMTIARILSCNERTVRNRRDRAYITLKSNLQEESA